MIRVKIKDDNLRFRAITELIMNGYKMNIANTSGTCLYIWTDGQKKFHVSHWTNDCPIKKIKEKDFKWLMNCIN